MVYKREIALDLRPYKPVLSTPLPKDKKTFYQAINYFLVTRSSMSANNNGIKFTYIFCPQFPVKQLNVLSPQPLLLIFSFHRWKEGVHFSVNKSIKKLKLRWALYRRIVVNLQSPFLTLKKSTSTLFSSPSNFPFSTNQTLFDFFLKGGEKRIKTKQCSPGGSLQPSAALGMLYPLL